MRSVCRKTNPQEWERLKRPRALCRGFAVSRGAVDYRLARRTQCCSNGTLRNAVDTANRRRTVGTLSSSRDFGHPVGPQYTARPQSFAGFAATQEALPTGAPGPSRNHRSRGRSAKRFQPSHREFPSAYPGQAAARRLARVPLATRSRTLEKADRITRTSVANGSISWNSTGEFELDASFCRANRRTKALYLTPMASFTLPISKLTAKEK